MTVSIVTNILHMLVCLFFFASFLSYAEAGKEGKNKKIRVKEYSCNSTRVQRKCDSGWYFGDSIWMSESITHSCYCYNSVNATTAAGALKDCFRRPDDAACDKCCKGISVSTSDQDCVTTRGGYLYPPNSQLRDRKCLCYVHWKVEGCNED